MKPAADFVHPLDADDADAPSIAIAESSGTYRPLLKWSVIVGAVAFFVALIGSVIGNNATGDMQLESIANAMNRYGMLVLLLAACSILVAVRGPKVMGSASKWSAGKLQRSEWAVLFVANLIGVGILSFTLLGFGLILGPYVAWIALCILPVAIGLMLTIALWHQGIVRAYAIGFLTSAIPLFITGAFYSIVWTSFLFGTMGNPYQPNRVSYSNGFFDGFSVAIPFLIGILVFASLSAFSGLVCAAYVAVLERLRHRRSVQGTTDSSTTESSTTE